MRCLFIIGLIDRSDEVLRFCCLIARVVGWSVCHLKCFGCTRYFGSFFKVCYYKRGITVVYQRGYFSTLLFCLCHAHCRCLCQLTLDCWNGRFKLFRWTIYFKWQCHKCFKCVGKVALKKVEDMGSIEAFSSWNKSKVRMS